MSIGRDASYNLVAAVAPALFLLAVVPFYIHVIGPDRFGVLALCWTLVTALRFASLGMGPALTFRLATMDEAPPDDRSSLVWTAVMLALVASIAGMVLVIVMGTIYFDYFFSAASVLNSEIHQALPIMACLLPPVILIGVLNGALQGRKRFGALSAISIVNAALLALTPLIVALLISIRLDVLILATLAANVMVVAIEFAICTKVIPLKRPKRTRPSDVQLVLGYGAWMSATAFIMPLVMLLDRFVIGTLRGPAAVAAYVLPHNLVQQLVLLPASLTSAVLPRLAPLSDNEVLQLQSSSLLWLNGMLTPISVVAIALAAPFFHLWIGPALGASASPAAVILLAGGWVHGIGHVPATILIGRSRPDLVTKLLLLNLFPYLAILYFATLYFGVAGAAAAWSIRAAFDPILFLYTNPSWADLRPVAISGGLVFCALISALAMSWTSASYWGVTLVLTSAATYQSRKTITAVLREILEYVHRQN